MIDLIQPCSLSGKRACKVLRFSATPVSFLHRLTRLVSFLSLFLISSVVTAQIQIGGDINGNATYDESGAAVAL